MEDPFVAEVLRKYERMKSQRMPFNTDWNDIRDFVRPITVSFNPQTGQFVTVRPETAFDGTAADSLEELSSTLHSYLTNPTERWFEIQVEGNKEAMQDHEVLRWCEQVSDTIYSQYQRADSGINLALHESYLDIGSYGSCSLYQEWSQKVRGLVFRAMPLAHCYFQESSEGHVDVVYRCVTWTVRQVKQEFGSVLPKKLMEIDDQEKPVEILHCVYPRGERDMSKYNAANKRFASVWICVSTKEKLAEFGYDTMPYHVARWTKLAGEVYGRGPAKKCLPDIKMLNAMERTLLKAGQKAVDPPLVLRNEAFMLPIRTSPGALIYKEDEEAQITPLHFEGNLPWGEDKAEQKRRFIQKCFYIDWIRMEKENVEMTAYEVQDRRDEKLRLLAPILGRVVSELHGPMIARSYALLDERGLIPPAPAMIRGGKLRVGYLSPAARAQLGSKANNISRFLQDLLPMEQVRPGTVDIVDFDEAARELGNARGVPRNVIMSPERIKQLRDEKAKQQQMQQAVAVAEPASKAIKNIADAQKAGVL